MILVLGTIGVLKLPELGYELHVCPGDVVFFLTNQQLHKLDVDHALPDAVQTVFTLWTDRHAMYGVCKAVQVQGLPHRLAGL
jgi:hypothetical protein